MKKELAKSVRARLSHIAKKENTDFQNILVRFALERLLYRIGKSKYAHRFLLKGALLFSLWYEMSHRSTRDIDLLAYGESDLLALKNIFQEIAAIQNLDGIIFNCDTITVKDIRKEAGYVGARIVIFAELADAKIKVQVDIGFGDAVTPFPVHSVYPVLISDFERPTLRTYPVYTVIAEKFHAMVILGIANSRLKDYLDLYVLFEKEKLDKKILQEAIHATFDRRKTPIPTEFPAGLSAEFWNDDSKQEMWDAFLSRNQLAQIPLKKVIKNLQDHFQDFLK